MTKSGRWRRGETDMPIRATLDLNLVLCAFTAELPQ